MQARSTTTTQTSDFTTSSPRQPLAVALRVLLLIAVPLLGGALPGKWCCSDSHCQDEESWLTYICKNNACVLSPIQPDGACSTAQECSDANPCTVDECDATNHCINTPIPGCCLGLADDECADNERCTYDFCDLQTQFSPGSPGTGTCTHFRIQKCCHQDEDCLACSTEKRTCVNGWCQRALKQNADCSEDSDCNSFGLGSDDLTYSSRCLISKSCLDNGKCHYEFKPNCCSTHSDCAPSCKDDACLEYSDAAYRTCERQLCDDDGVFLPVPFWRCVASPDPIWCQDAESCDDGLESTADACIVSNPCLPPTCQHILSFSSEVKPCNAKIGEADPSCNDGVECTVDRCLSVAEFRIHQYGTEGYHNLLIDWSTAPPEFGNMMGICLNTWLPGCCETTSDCLCGQDSVAACIDYRCTCHSTGACESSTECTDNNVCTTDTCIGGRCVYSNISGCCTEHSQCKDNNALTLDLCDAPTLTCKNEPIDTNCVDDGDCADGSKCINFNCVADGLQPQKDCDNQLDCVAAFGPCGDQDFGAICVDGKCDLSAAHGCCDKGLRIVLAEETLKPKLDWQLQRLANDWRAEGACAAVFYVNEETAPATIQKRLRAYLEYARSKPGLVGIAGLFLVGRIRPFAVEVTNGSGETNWAMTDQVYMAPEGPWKEVTSSRRSWTLSYLTKDATDKYPLAVGRILVPKNIGGEIAVLSQYFSKLHAFRYGGKAEWKSGNGRAVLFSPYDYAYWQDQLAGMKALFGITTVNDQAVCFGTGSIENIDIVQAPASTKAKLFNVLAQPYYWMTVESHLNVKEWDLAIGTVTAEEVKSSAQVGPNFFWHQTCHSGEIARLNQEGYWEWEDDAYALRLLGVGANRGLAVVARGSTGRDSCHHDVFYKALANGKSIGDALREKLHVTVRKLRLNEFDKCDIFKYFGFTTILFGDPFLVPGSVEE